ncbi:MAG: aminotransferase class V-fold PLP-dependent enzyme [Clostridia bacterium]
MIYLDNAATSRFKPQGVFDALNYDITHSANSGRSGHDDAISASIKIENCRSYLLSSLHADNDFNLVFTKNCTEALNLAIFGFGLDGKRVVTTANEHNSVLRPLFEMERQGKISLHIIGQQDDGKISIDDIAQAFKTADFAVLNAVSNVTGAKLDIDAVGNLAKKNNVTLLADGSQAIPLTKIDMQKQNINMLACPGHKGLHGVTGTGFLIFKKDIKLKPLLFGGTGTASLSPYQPTDAPEAYEAGTMFSGGIAALMEGAKWSFENADKSRKITQSLCNAAAYYLSNIGATIYVSDTSSGVLSFNLKDIDSSFVAEKLNEFGIAVRSGLHCAPLVHKFLGTEKQGAVRVSIGVDNTEKDIFNFAVATEKIAKQMPTQHTF